MSLPNTRSGRFSWRSFFERSGTAVFVIGGNRRLRYANTAWERLTGESIAHLRGMRVSDRLSASNFGNTLAPPPEVWAGVNSRVRRPAPSATAGPPWWDIQFLPLLGKDNNRVLGVVGCLAVVGIPAVSASVKMPASAGEVRAKHAGRYVFDVVTGISAASGRLLSQVRAAAAFEAPVWVVGEPGSGKETVARIIHHNSPRKERTFVGLRCGGLQPYLIEGMLFGKGGVATGSQVGTLYLKQPDRLPSSLQDRLLKWCESPFGPRLICGAIETSQLMVQEGRLSSQFYTRFSPFEIRVPPLRERLDDLPKYLSILTPHPPAEDVVDALKAYHWPGNIRELAEVVSTNSHPLRLQSLPRVIRERGIIDQCPPVQQKPPPKLDDVLVAVEKRLITAALVKTGWQMAEAAEILGIWRSRLSRRMAALGLLKSDQGSIAQGGEG